MGKGGGEETGDGTVRLSELDPIGVSSGVSARPVKVVADETGEREEGVEMVEGELSSGDGATASGVEREMV